MTPAVLIREDTLSELVLDGALFFDGNHDGKVTDHAMPDRTYAASGITVRPEMISADILVSPNPTIAGLTTGPERIAEVLEWLTEARRAGAPVSLQRPGRAQVPDLLVERFSERAADTDTLRMTLWLKQARFAQTSAVQIAATGPSGGTPRTPSDVARDGEAESEGGRRSLLATGLDELSGFLGVSP